MKIITGCSSICIRQCGKTLIWNIESIFDFDIYIEMLEVVNVVEVMNCDWELWRDFIVFTDATNSN